MASKSVHRAHRDPFVYIFGILSLLGLFDALLLTAEHYISLTLPCSFSGGCERVLTSQYSTILGQPISLLGVVFYGVVLFLAIHSLSNSEPMPKRFLVGWGLIGFLSSLVLTGIQAFIIRAWCQYCLLSALTSTVIFIVALVYYFRRPKPVTQTKEEEDEEA